MQTTIIRKNSIKPNKWDGGETFEYFIYPPTSSYANRDFLFRISSASITKIPSNFTKFNDYQRFLVMLDNDLEINRNGQNEVYTQEEIFRFASHNEIISYSLGNDFNLMVHDDVAFSSVEILNQFKVNTASFIFLLAKVKTELQVDNQTLKLEKDDLLCIENIFNKEITLKSNQKIICVSITM